MSLTDLIYLSQKSLRSNILRSVLTSLGIIIGVSSVITMISIGTGARLEVEQQIERFGSNNLILDLKVQIVVEFLWVIILLIVLLSQIWRH